MVRLSNGSLRTLMIRKGVKHDNEQVHGLKALRIYRDIKIGEINGTIMAKINAICSGGI